MYYNYTVELTTDYTGMFDYTVTVNDLCWIHNVCGCHNTTHCYILFLLLHLTASNSYNMATRALADLSPEGAKRPRAINQSSARGAML